jgi:hypothetical protein
MTEICVVHLVWKPLGLKPLQDFLTSYQQQSAGIDHRLVIAFNGFDSEAEFAEYRAALAGVPYESLVISPPTQDIPAYFTAARTLECEHLCFLNSYSVLLNKEWLAKLYEHSRRDQVGLVGATGSWQSQHSMTMYTWGEPSAYTDVVSDLKDGFPRRVAAPLFQLSDSLKEKMRSMRMLRRLALRVYYYGLVAPYYVAVNSVRTYNEKRREIGRYPAGEYDPFPAIHLRTSSFMLRRELMLRLKTWKMPTKNDAYRFESGKESMTNQVLRMGLKVMVVGRDGRAYEPEEWPNSETFCQGEQRNLLVADNHTRLYSQSEPLFRTLLSRAAWGRKSWSFRPANGWQSERGRNEMW